VRKLMAEHIDEAEHHVHQVAAAVRPRFVLESDLRARIAHPKPSAKEKSK
jgi:GntR family transcriptional repressor for pyruvate dehydrogenase complex